MEELQEGASLAAVKGHLKRNWKKYAGGVALAGAAYGAKKGYDAYNAEAPSVEGSPRILIPKEDQLANRTKVKEDFRSKASVSKTTDLGITDKLLGTSKTIKSMVKDAETENDNDNQDGAGGELPTIQEKARAAQDEVSKREPKTNAQYAADRAARVEKFQKDKTDRLVAHAKKTYGEKQTASKQQLQQQSDDSIF